ncbi:Concanavalin A-like lectin/glucanases superfamily protein [Roseivivax lentus]|uniref:Concanavalin A-like lectin/glucanases superfamily protein n=1 Tax=Roseivivax lentus TaxID=633194 RepID=A0A1N7P8A5_9RHOB|nr:LamG-like jellyroll fold domain-containing protein [Roseivivax lentus]SIT06813.1 Concanavalin A-like lectin/glucanases superfamily protein [Roseivivax lentus]
MISVTTRAQLENALASAQAGDEIVLAAGDYGSFDFNGYNYSGYVTVRSADPDNPAVFDQIDIVGSSFLAIDSVHVDNPSNGAASSKVVNIDGNSHDIVFSNSEVNGSVTTSTNYNEFQGHYGIYTGGNVRNIRIEEDEVHDVKNGFVALGSDNIEVVGNHFDRLGNDTMKFAGVNGVLIENNIGPTSNFPSPTAHVDFIQFQGSSENITIRGNVSLAGNIGTTQAIFMADGSYNNVLIEQNILYTGMLHGITLYSGANVTIRDNTVLNAPDLVHKATVIQSPDGATVTGNIISATGYDGKVSGGNLYVQHDQPNQAHHYSDYFPNAETGLGVTLQDLVPLAGSLAEQYGAYERLMELLNGDTWVPQPVPQPDPDPQPESEPDPQPQPDLDPAEGTVFSLPGELTIADAGDVFEMAHSAELEISSGTVAFSFTADDVAGVQGLVAKDASGYVGGGHHFAAYLQGNTLMVRLQDAASDAYLSLDGIEAGKTYAVAITFGPDGGELWVNGEQVSTTELVMDWTQNQQHLQWGGLGWASADQAAGYVANFQGTISDATVYDNTSLPEPVPQPEPEQVPQPGPDPQPELDLDPNEGAVFSLPGELTIADAGDVFEMAHSSELEISSGTVAFSFTADDVAGLQGLVAKDASGYAGGGHHFAAFLKGNTLVIRLQDAGSEAYMTLDDIEAGTTYAVAVTFGPDGGELWVNGEQVSTTDLVIDWTQNQQHLQWGGLGWASADQAAGFVASFQGTISDATVYDNTLETLEYSVSNEVGIVEANDYDFFI